MLDYGCDALDDPDHSGEHGVVSRPRLFPKDVSCSYQHPTGDLSYAGRSLIGNAVATASPGALGRYGRYEEFLTGFRADSSVAPI